MSNELELVDRFDRMNKIVELYLKGSNPNAIAKELGIKRVEVLEYVNEYREIARNDDAVKDRAREALHSADEALNMVQKRNWETVEQADTASDYRTKAGLLKNIADIEAKRVEMLQKAGLYDDAALGDELAEMEEKAEAIRELLKQVAEEYPQARDMIMRGLGKIFGQPQGITLSGEVVQPGTL